MCGVAGSSIARRWPARSEPPLKRIPQRRKNPARRSKGTRRLNDREQAIDDAPGYVVSRTCTVVDEREPQRDGGGQSPLADYADTAAYVLIAEPGAGKTTALKTEAAKQGAVCVTVRNFLRFDKPEWRDATLFLDGLDESRAGPGDKRRPLDGIVTKLDRLGCPPFRLSCRWGDWLAANDKEGLREVSPDGTVTVLRLEPLSKRNIKDILVKNHGVEDADAFVAAARQRGVDRLLRNPQNLKLLAKSVARGEWPKSRRETFEQACRMLVHEPNREHRAGNPSAAATDPLIEAAGRLCASTVGRQRGLHTSGPCGTRRRLPVPGGGRRRSTGPGVAGAGHAAVHGSVGRETGADPPANRGVPRGPTRVGALGGGTSPGAGSGLDHGI